VDLHSERLGSSCDWRYGNAQELAHTTTLTAMSFLAGVATMSTEWGPVILLGRGLGRQVAVSVVLISQIRILASVNQKNSNRLVHS
jgi:hypothetical protein